jgi:rhomboid family GlyGly-CTERM serine protease
MFKTNPSLSSALNQLRPIYKNKAIFIPLGLAILILLLGWIGAPATEWLRYQRDAVQSGQLWRLLTGNLVHLGWSHIFLNLGGLVLVWILFQRHFTGMQWLVLLFSSSLGVCLGLLLFDPNLVWYVGLSGTLHGLFIAGSLADIRTGEKSGYILLIAIAGKLLWEQLHGPLPGTAEAAGGNVVVDAHLYGALAGFSGLLLKPRK